MFEKHKNHLKSWFLWNKNLALAPLEFFSQGGQGGGHEIFRTSRENSQEHRLFQKGGGAREYHNIFRANLPNIYFFPPHRKILYPRLEKQTFSGTLNR